MEAKEARGTSPPAGIWRGTEDDIMSGGSKTLPHRERRGPAIPKLVPPSSWDPICPSPAIGLH